MLDSELLFYKSKVVTDDTTNGGRMSTNLVTSGVVQNFWPHVNKALRDSGNESNGQYRKGFIKAANDDDEALLNSGFYLHGDTLGDDRVYFWPGTQRNTQADTSFTTPSQKFVSGYLKTGIGSTDTTATVVFKTNDQALIPGDGDKVIIIDKTDPDSGTGNQTVTTISGAPSVSTVECTMTFADQAGYAYAANNTQICMVYEPGSNVEASVDNKVVTSTAGTFDETLMTLDSIGTVEQTITITFTSATAFTVASDDGDITLASGDITTEYAPSNADFTKPYFTIPITCWGGTYAASDTVVFQTHPCAIPTIQQRVIPVGCSSLANNRIRQVVFGESET